jgi:hypothetical protein
MIWMVIALVGIGGAVTLRAGLRGRQIDNHPLCRRCGFDLTGRLAHSAKCAECGGAPWHELFPSSQMATPASAAPRRVDVILRSDPGPAAGSTNVFDFWDGVIEFKDLPVTPD